MFNKILQNNEIFKSIQDNITDKITNPVYGIFVVFWLFFHWKFIYTAIFISEEKIWEFTGGQLKSDYLSQTFFNYSDPHFYLLWIFPFIFTWLFIWKFPKWVFIPAFLKFQKYNTEKLEIKLAEEIKIRQKQLEFVKLTGEKTRKEKEIKEQEKELKIIDPTTTWEEEFKKIFLDEKDVQAIREGNTTIYTTNGKFVSDPRHINSGYNSYISASSLSRLDALGLVAIVGDHKNIIEFTDKGKFFIRKLQERQMI